MAWKECAGAQEVELVRLGEILTIILSVSESVGNDNPYPALVETEMSKKGLKEQFGHS